MKEDTWARLEELFGRWPLARASAVMPEAFDQEMEIYGNIDPDYREFVLLYGGGIVGPNPIYGINAPEWVGSIGGRTTAPKVTQWFRDKRWPGTENWLIFSIDQGGNPIGFALDSNVWLSDRMDFGQSVQIASGFEDYLLKWCFMTREVVDY